MFNVVLRHVILAALALIVSVAAPSTVAAQPCDNTGCDPNPPTVSVSGGTVINPSVTITITWCDDNALVGGTRTVTVNGVDVTSQFNFSGTTGPCYDDAISTGTVTLSPGLNTVVATIEDYVGNVGTGSNQYTVLNGGVTVMPKALPITRLARKTFSDTFQVTNIGVNSASFNLNVTHCTGVATSCSITTSSPITLAASATGNVVVQYTAANTPGTGGLGIRARLTTDTTVADSGSFVLTTQNSLVVDASINNDDARDMTLCAYSCGTAVHAVSTVSWFSGNVTRV